MGVLFSHWYLGGYLLWIYSLWGVTEQADTVPNTCGTLDHGWQLDLLVLHCCFCLTWWLTGIANFDIHQSLPVLSCGISSFEAAAGSLHYIMPALVRMEEIQTSFFLLWRGNRKTQETWGQRNTRIRWNSWVLQHPPNVLGQMLWLWGKGAVPKCAAKPDAGKAVMCQLRLWWRKKCWLLWLLKILTLWCLDGQGLVNCATGWVTVWEHVVLHPKKLWVGIQDFKSPCPNHILEYALVLSVLAAFLACEWVLVALLSLLLWWWMPKFLRADCTFKWPESVSCFSSWVNLCIK